jgi:tetratricopeptide (TPR) repeat protein
MELVHAKYNRIFATVVFCIAVVAFFFTMAPTVAFWDCGEYTAAGASFGVPHPPGNILLMAMLRVVSLLFSFFKDIGYRMNFLVILFSAGTASLVYLIAVRVTISFMGIPDTTWKRITVYTGGVVAGLYAVFGSTFWFSAVETSEANVAMFFVALTTLLVLVWAQSKDEHRDRILLLLTYLSFLGIGIHMYSMIVLPPIFLYVILTDEAKRKDWRLWGTAILLGLVIKDLILFIYVAPVVTIITFTMSSVAGPNQKKWRFAFWMSFLAMLGFSCHLIIPIRSALEPIINENHPDHWIAFKEYLERKQYGAEDMFGRMFWRRGTWGHQFGIEGHMGYGGFHITQFFHFSTLDTQKNFLETGIAGFAKLLVYLVPTGLMLFAWGYLYKRNRNVAIYLIALFIITSVVMTLYMNFADGTRPEHRDYLYWLKSGKQGPMPVVHREVRVRDYFWCAAFMYLGMWMGVGASALLHFLFTHKKTFQRTTLAPIMAILFMASPVLPMTQNWNDASRRGDWIPYDYAYNLLQSCEKDGIIFTNGDNDTFPLWALQEAYGIRKDVRIVNLSLLNTTWYIKQLKKLEPKVAISYSDEQIDALRHQLNPIVNPSRYRMPKAGIEVMLPTRKELNALRVQDQMVVNIVDANGWKKPIYFAVTVSDDNLMGIGPYLKMQGLVYRVMPKVVAEQDRLDISRTVHLLDNVYRFRGLGDGTARLNDTSEKLLSNYAASYIQIALSMRRPLQTLKSEVDQLKARAAAPKDSSTGDSSLASTDELAAKEKVYKDSLNLVLDKLNQCVGLMPADWRPRVLRHEVLMSNDMSDIAEKDMRKALEIDPTNEEYMKYLVQALEKNGKREEANGILKKLLKDERDPWFAHATLARNYENLGMYDSAIAVMEQFTATHPGDRRANSYIMQLKAMQQKPVDTAAGDSTALTPPMSAVPAAAGK